jgi:hypothetical protein
MAPTRAGMRRTRSAPSTALRTSTCATRACFRPARWPIRC